MWGKGRRLEIHNNPLQRSTLVRIPSDYLRQKILEKNVWYVGDSMFHTSQWSSVNSSGPSPLSSIQIWAHLTGVPLDLRHQKGLSLVAGLIGNPKETDDFTLNLVNLSLSHVKVEVDLTQELPQVVEFQRQSGEVVEVQVDYPWLPPTCSHCKELGHVMRNCLSYTPPPPPPPPEPSNSTPSKDHRAKQKVHSSIPTKKSATHTKSQQYVAVKKNLPPVVAPVVAPDSSSHPPSSFSLPSSPLSSHLALPISVSELNTSQSNHQSPSDKPKKPSLKRCRSSPSLSPPSHPKTIFQSSTSSSTSSRPHPPLFPVVGTLQYLKQSNFTHTPLSNPFSPLLSVDSLQPAGDPTFSQ